MVNIKFAKVNEMGKIPTKRKEDAGYDIYATIDDVIKVIEPHTTQLIPTGIASAIPQGYYFQIQERGSTGSKGIKYGAGVIDSGYRGEWFIPITNTNNVDIVLTKSPELLVPLLEDDIIDDIIIYPLSKAICQAVLLPVPNTTIQEVSYNELKNIPSERGTGSLGSSKK